MQGPTGSTNTGKAAGAVALVIAAGKEHTPPIDLSPDESRAILEQTAEDVTQPNTAGAGHPDPAQPGWDEHFGYGRADVGEAVEVAKNGTPPPEASIDSPDWYAPLTGATASLTWPAPRAVRRQRRALRLQGRVGAGPRACRGRLAARARRRGRVERHGHRPRQP